jgi:hypothetical protein
MATTPKKPTTPQAGPELSEEPLQQSPNYFSLAATSVERQLTSNHISGGLGEYSSTNSLLLDKSEFITFTKPTDLLVSRHYPNYQIFNKSGSGADETLGVLLAQSLDSESALEDFRVVLASPDIPSAIINALLPRVTLTVRRGRYLMSEKMIDKEVMDKLSGTTTDPNVVSAISHVITRVLKHMNLVIDGPERKIARMASGFALSMADIKRLILTESLRDIFSDARIAMFTKELDADTSPNLIGEQISTMLRHASHSIPEIRLRLEQLDTVQGLVQLYYRKPEELSNTLRATSNLATLANFANFLANAVSTQDPIYTLADNSTSREACSAILTILQSAPEIEVIPLKKYADYFGLVPCSAADGIYRGLVAYLPLSQASKLDVVNNYDTGPGQELALIPREYIPATTLAPEISRSLSNPEAMLGLANLVADEIATARWSMSDAPIMRTIGMLDVDVIYLAMARAEIIAIIRTSEAKAIHFSLVYASKVSEYWRTRLEASTPSISYFGDPQSMLIYQSGATAQVPVSLPARSQSIELAAAYDINYQGAITDHLESDIAKPLSFEIVLLNPNDVTGKTTLKLRISPLELLVGPNPMLQRGGAKYSIVREPAVDRDIAIILSMAAAFASAKEPIIADKAKSWMVESLTPLATHPAVTRVAIKALNTAVVQAKLDARTLTPQYKEAIVRAYFGTLLALLVRFGKIDEQIMADINNLLSVNALSVKAALSLATMPTALDASESLL